METAEINQLFNKIYEVYYYDFRSYSQASIRRRLQFILGKFNIPTLEGLEQKLINDETFFYAALQHLFVPTTEMFRNPGQFLQFRRDIIPMLKTYPSSKFWIAGCSTGEEVFSYAILLKEEGLLEKTLIYATDINLTSLTKAKEGIFPLDKIKQYSKNYIQAGGTSSLSEYFTINENVAQFSKDLSRQVVFSDHCLATDNVFAEVQFVSCRNVLIYFDRELQDRAIRLFHESLCHRGYLALGDKESLRFSLYKDKFIDLPDRNSLYQKLG